MACVYSVVAFDDMAEVHCVTVWVMVDWVAVSGSSVVVEGTYEVSELEELRLLLPIFGLILMLLVLIYWLLLRR